MSCLIVDWTVYWKGWIIARIDGPSWDEQPGNSGR